MTKQLDAGAALEKVIRDDLPPNVELDPREELLLRAAAAQADDVAALEADIRERGHIVDGTVSASVREVRQGRANLARLLGGIDCLRRPPRPSCGPRKPLRPVGKRHRDA